MDARIATRHTRPATRRQPTRAETRRVTRTRENHGENALTETRDTDPTYFDTDQTPKTSLGWLYTHCQWHCDARDVVRRDGRWPRESHSPLFHGHIAQRPNVSTSMLLESAAPLTMSWSRCPTHLCADDGSFRFCRH